MGVLKFNQQVKVRVPAKRMFKAFVTETYDVLPKIIPNAIINIEILEGDGGVGTVRQTNFAQGFPFPYMKHKIEELDVENCLCKYTLIEGAMLGNCLDSIYYDQKYEDTPDGGCIIKIMRECRTNSEIRLNEAEVKAGEQNSLAIFKHVEEYLLAHPDVCP